MTIIQKLKSIAQTSAYTYPELVQLHVLEGMVRRVAASAHKNLLVLRGGMMSRHWYAPGKWMPGDIDFMVQTPLPTDQMEKLWQEVLSIGANDDIDFETNHISSEVTWAEAKDPGLRLFVQAKVAGFEENINTKIDISYADPVVPEATFRSYATLLPESLPKVKMVHRETSAGWKFYGLFERKNDKWRAKDLFGLYWLLTRYNLDLTLVMESFRETSVERGTPLGMAARFFENRFAKGKGSQRLWRAFCHKHPSFALPEDLPEILQLIRQTLAPHFVQLIETYSQVATLGERGFPVINHIDEVLMAIKDREEFQVYERGNYRIIDYRNQLKYSFLPTTQAMHPSVASIYALRKECRGLIFDQNGRLVHRKLHKFFRIGETEESRLENINWSVPCRILEKLDGSLVAPVVWDSTLRWATRKGLSDIADQAGAFAERQQKKQATTGYLVMINALLENGWTPVFEWCSRQHPIVLDYPEDRLVLTAVRNNHTGHYLKYDAMVELARKHHIECIQQTGVLNNVAEARTFTEATAAEKTGEGYVLRFPDDRFYKVKNDWYLKLHQLVANESNEIYIWQATLKGELDAMLASVAPGLRGDVKTFSLGLERAFATQATWLQNFVAQAHSEIYKVAQDAREANKIFALSYARRLDNIKQAIAFDGWHTYQTHGEASDFKQLIKDFALDNCRTRKRLQRIRLVFR